MTPLEALKEAEKWRSLDPDGMAVLCQGYRAALAENEVLRSQDPGILVRAVFKELEAARAEADRLAGLIKQVEFADGSWFCPWCKGSTGYEEEHTDCPAFTPDGEVKR